jgi:nicotinamidase/pyrazinamidase
MKPALILTNIQNDYFEGGNFPIKSSSDIIPLINHIRSTYDCKFQSVFLTQNTFPPTHISFKTSPYAKEENLPFDQITLDTKGKFSEHCVLNTQGANFEPEMLIKGTENIIRIGEDKFKAAMSGFANSSLDKMLKAQGIDTVFIGGLSFDFFVGLTALDSKNAGYETYVIKDICKSIGEKSEEAMRKNLEINNIKIITLKEFEQIMKNVPKIEDN